MTEQTGTPSGNQEDAIRTEMSKVRVAIMILEKDDKIPPKYKIEDFKRKVRLVAGEHTTGAPPVVTYSSVVSATGVSENCSHGLLP